MSIDLDKHYRVDGYDGIAWYLRGYVVTKLECQGHLDELGGTMGETFYCDDSCEEPTEDQDQVRAVMVGDDREFVFDVSDLHLLSEDDFCSGCGQIGCTVESLKEVMM